MQHVWDTEWEQNLLSIAIERVKRKVSSKQFQIFDLAVLREWPAAQISEALEVTSSYVYLTKHRVHRRFKAELQALQKEAQ